MTELAIVIPAYKAKFLDLALSSIANQTNKNFNLYIGDDCSPEGLEVICTKYSSMMNMKYTRFDSNIGAEKLVNQWNRCVNLIKKEKWVWLFSDDDVADLNCVDVFYETIRRDNSKFDVYRFDTRVINDDGIIISQTPESPDYDTSINMAYEILMGRRGNSMPDHIFSFEVFQSNGGFVYTDFAQASDWASSILFSQKKGIYTMQGAKVNWRLGNNNISGLAKKNRVKMIKGYLQFLKWVLTHFKNLTYSNNTFSYSDIMDATDFSLHYVIKNHYKGISYKNLVDIYLFYSILYRSRNKAFKRTIILYKNFN